MTRPSIWVGDTRYAYYKTATAQIDYLEEAFNWIPALGEAVTTISCIAEGEMISLSQNAEETEREIHATRLMNDGELHSFG